MRPHAREVAAYLASIGATAIRIEPARSLGHPKIAFEYAGREWRTVIAGTPSTPFSAQHKINDLKRLLGLRDGQRRIGERRKRKRQRRVAARSDSGVIRVWRNDDGPFNAPFARIAEMLAGVAK